MRRVKFLYTQRTTLLSLALLTLVSLSAHPDPAGDKKRAQLAPVHRIAVVPIFFATDTLGELPPKQETKPAPKPPVDEKRKAQLADYMEMLRKLEAHSREYLLQRVAARTPYEVISAQEMENALKELKLTPAQLFQNGGRQNGKHNDAPDLAAVRKLAQQLHADALLLSTMDEPRKIDGHYLIDTFGEIGYDSSKVTAKSDYTVLLADGSLVLHQNFEVLHPATHSGNRQFLLTDWMETEEEVNEDFLDELTRYTPIKK